MIEYGNDLWRYRINDSTWTWISGSNIADQQGVYGEKGNGSTDHYPGARWIALGWYDDLREEFWLLGGLGFSTTTFLGTQYSILFFPLSLP